MFPLTCRLCAPSTPPPCGARPYRRPRCCAADSGMPYVREGSSEGCKRYEVFPLTCRLCAPSTFPSHTPHFPTLDGRLPVTRTPLLPWPRC